MQDEHGKLLLVVEDMAKLESRSQRQFQMAFLGGKLVRLWIFHR